MTIKEPNICITYSRKKYNRWINLWDQWKLIDLHGKPWRYWGGNIRTFGLNSGLKSNMYLWSPFLSKLVHWKYRHMHLEIPYTTRDTLGIINGGKSKLTPPNQPKG